MLNFILLKTLEKMQFVLLAIILSFGLTLRINCDDSFLTASDLKDGKASTAVGHRERKLLNFKRSSPFVL